MSDDTMMVKGLEIRRRVLGAEYVDAALKSADEFMGDLQKLVSTYCWGVDSLGIARDAFAKMDAEQK